MEHCQEKYRQSQLQQLTKKATEFGFQLVEITQPA